MECQEERYDMRQNTEADRQKFAHDAKLLHQFNQAMPFSKEAKDIFDTTKKRLDELKIILYGKFGSRLRLEED